MHTINRELVFHGHMAGDARRSRSYLLVTIFLLSLASFGVGSTQAAESNVPLDPWSYVDSSTDIRTTRITTAGEDLVISTFVENDKTIRTKLFHPDVSNLPIVVIHEEANAVIQSLEVIGENCEGANQCR